MQELSNKITFDYSSLDEAFPPCDPGIEPLGSRVLVQIRTPTVSYTHLTLPTICSV